MTEQTAAAQTTTAQPATAAPATAASRAKLGTRDYILIGVYAALYFVLIAIAAAVVQPLPFGMPFMGFACGILGGVPYMLTLTKSRRFGAVTILGVLLALLMGVIHGNVYTIVTAVAASVIADLIARTGDYRRMSLNVLSAGVFNLWNLGLFLPFYIGRNDYLAAMVAKKGETATAQMAGLFPAWILPVLVVLGVIGGLIGAWIARSMMRRHFERAGLV
ncbi:MptD family putative ECF transporter S component [Bifidobacterium simiarum]|uniref:MptD family putative ECF transporter S component n=1 Tax=Bifidobacterium simiarum TaxID=2045441 RepID=UPI001BDD1B09|nr:MptD family putative ECF transporter S component [Bifidobacterium simiarum]MBT1166096.1 MptD family putative ECF transporter S component [Bifidobacterium simiarum]